MRDPKTCIDEITTVYDLSYGWIANVLGIHRSTVAKWTQGVSPMVPGAMDDLNNLVKWLAFYGPDYVDPDGLFHLGDILEVFGSGDPAEDWRVCLKFAKSVLVERPGLLEDDDPDIKVAFTSVRYLQSLVRRSARERETEPINYPSTTELDTATTIVADLVGWLKSDRPLPSAMLKDELAKANGLLLRANEALMGGAS